MVDNTAWIAHAEDLLTHGPKTSGKKSWFSQTRPKIASGITADALFVLNPN